MNPKANLKAAIHQNDLHWIRQLLDEGVDVNDRYTRNETTPLISAAAAGHEEILRELISRGAEINACTKDSYTALMAACEWDHPELAEILLEEGADVTIATTQSGRRFSAMDDVDPFPIDDFEGAAPAASIPPPAAIDAPFPMKPLGGESDLPGLSALPPGGQGTPAAPDIYTGQSTGDEMDATFGQYTDSSGRIAVRDLEEGDEEPYGYTALVYACANNNLDLVKHLIEHGAPVDSCTSKNETGISMACSHDHADTIQTLLEAKANPNTIINNERLSVFMWACEKGSVRLVKSLMDYGADLNLSDIHGNTALSLASRNGHNLIIKLLAEKEVNLDQVNDRGETALIAASSNGHVAIVEDLLMAGANPRLKTEKGQIALLSAASKGKANVVRKILQHPSFAAEKEQEAKELISNSLMPAIRNGHTEVVKILLEFGADPNKAMMDGTTVTMEAAYLRENATLKLLLDAGADPNNRNDFGSTALIKAAYEWPLHLQIPDNMGGPAGDVMVQAGNTTDKKQDEMEVPPNPRDTEHCSVTMQILLDAGSNPNGYDNKGISSLSQRILAKDEKGIRTLISGGVDTTKCARDGRLSTDEIQVLDKHFPGIAGLLKKQEMQGTGAIVEIDETGF